MRTVEEVAVSDSETSGKRAKRPGIDGICRRRSVLVSVECVHCTCEVAFPRLFFFFFRARGFGERNQIRQRTAARD